jgi:hypothetical protein
MTDPNHHGTGDEGMRARLALAIILLVSFVLAVLMFREVPVSNRDLLNFALGVLFASLKDVFGYSFGSSAGRDKQADTLNTIAKTAERASSAAMPDASADASIPVAPGESVTVKGETE